ncbi:MAG: hypothetical protein QOE37_1824 [Microbacteriaceae bacterium]|nr:hypothetical protein [Microbacteriaceae bacterium]
MLAIVGSTGRTGTLVAEEAARRGIDLLLVGRNREALAAQAGRFGCRFAAVSLQRQDELVAALRPADAVLNVAGPFADTALPVLTAAARARTHYLDLSNDLEPVRAVLARDRQLLEAGIVALPAAGFGTVATDGLARLLVDAVPDAVRIELGIAIGADGQSPGVAASTRQVLASGARRLVEGRLERAPIGRGAFRAPADGPTLVPVGLADLAVTPATTGVDTVTVGVAVPLPRWSAPVLLPVLSAAMRGARPTAARGRTREPVSRAWARVVRPDGSEESAWLTAGEGFRFSADSAVTAAQLVLGGGVRPGAATVSGRYGAVFLAGLRGVRIDSTLGDGRRPGA